MVHSANTAQPAQENNLGIGFHASARWASLTSVTRSIYSRIPVCGNKMATFELNHLDLADSPLITIPYKYWDLDKESRQISPLFALRRQGPQFESAWGTTSLPREPNPGGLLNKRATIDLAQRMDRERPHLNPARVASQLVERPGPLRA